MGTRVRYAPSPTGLQHIGGVRTALSNYLFARSCGGAFVLRLEDTDRTRFDERYVGNLFDTLSWLGLSYDEGPLPGGGGKGDYGPYVQSERAALYRGCARELVDRGQAYYCFCTEARLEALRAEREAAHSGATGYDRLCRALAPEEARRRAEGGEACVVRLRIPLGEVTAFHDLLLGDIVWKNDDVNPDPVLLKSDGFPTYHLANVVDDHLMKITRVCRAQEWLASTPLHVLLYRAFGWEPPEFCHLPLLMGSDGKKLSKRHGATSVDEFRAQGCLPEALLNYVALLGASYEEGREIYSLDELAALFSLDKLNKSPAIFDYKKLEWFNGQYIRAKTDEELAALALPFAVEAGLFSRGGAKREPDASERALFAAAMPLVRERAVYLRDIPAKLRYLFAEPDVPAPEEFIPRKGSLAGALALLEEAESLVPSLAACATDGEAEALVKGRAEALGVKSGDLLTPLRAALTGSRVSPPLFGSLRLLGAERARSRVERALSSLRGGEPPRA